MLHALGGSDLGGFALGGSVFAVAAVGTVAPSVGLFQHLVPRPLGVCLAPGTRQLDHALHAAASTCAPADWAVESPAGTVLAAAMMGSDWGQARSRRSARFSDVTSL